MKETITSITSRSLFGRDYYYQKYGHTWECDFDQRMCFDRKLWKRFPELDFWANGRTDALFDQFADAVLFAARVKDLKEAKMFFASFYESWNELTFEIYYKAGLLKKIDIPVNMLHSVETHYLIDFIQDVFPETYLFLNALSCKDELIQYLVTTQRDVYLPAETT